MALSATARPIAGAVATQGVSDRVNFLRKTYSILSVALIAFAALTAGIITYAPTTSLRFSAWAFGGNLNWLLVLGLFMVVGYVAQRLAMSETSRGLQYVGLGVGVIAQSILLQPLIWVLMYKFGSHGIAHGGYVVADMTGQAATILGEAVVITLAIFIGLTLTVFITKKDFTFMRGALMMGTFALLGIILASMVFGFHLGIVFLAFGILLMGGYILYQTSLVMSAFPPTGYVAAALMLFSTIATLFWYVLQMLMEMNRR
ncbi:MAG TPA: Bax inhibitor-1 family protein [Kofleriaceae bacterium]